MRQRSRSLMKRAMNVSRQFLTFSSRYVRRADLSS